MLARSGPGVLHELTGVIAKHQGDILSVEIIEVKPPDSRIYFEIDLPVAPAVLEADLEKLSIVSEIKVVTTMQKIYGKRIIIVGGGAQVGQVAIGAISEADRHNIRGEHISVDTIPLVGEQPIADAQVRLHMVQLATAGQAGFIVDDREVRKAGPSYSVETLAELRHEYPDRSLCLIVGMDAFLSLPKWHQWQELLQLAHLVVAHRPGWRAPGMGPLGELLVDRGTGRIGDLHEQRAGCIYIHAVTQLEISSTEVRQLIAMGRDPRFLMPDSVRKLILDTHCYAKSRTP